MPERQPCTVIWHPSSTSGQRADAMRTELDKHPHVEVLEVDGTSETEQAVFERVSRPGVIAAAGGDGTVRQVVSAIMQARANGKEVKATFAVLPLGTGNDLARGLQIPFVPEQAIDVLLSQHESPLDVVEFETPSERGWCANMVTGGNSGRYLEVMTDELKERWGAFCYLRGIIDVIKNLETFEIELRCDGEPSEKFTALNVFFANGRTSGGGMVVSPDAAVDDGKLDVLIVRDGQPGAIAGLTASYFLSDYKSHDLIAFRRASQIVLKANPDLLLTADGDSIGATPLTLKVHPAALQVKTPAASAMQAD
ncbi:diacylglycerol/lipid kinase family protein [Planctomicrobium piriforme]|uniref:Diacylglycerol kinase (ATP) n=1 Tax=Planctomicrobium piriforme TaxID=1576369 RepID=A0A1I3F3E3_9PLAN|nr:diacylglycerol kinase family protein [Planctomicrobium piriforme]SFI05759.1 diacylglycerol kinase (ATP) [Planctomicrobium piriforme]